MYSCHSISLLTGSSVRHWPLLRPADFCSSSLIWTIVIYRKISSIDYENFEKKLYKSGEIAARGKTYSLRPPQPSYGTQFHRYNQQQPCQRLVRMKRIPWWPWKCLSVKHHRQKRAEPSARRVQLER